MIHKKKKILILTNVDWFLISHRLVLAKAAVKAGWKVYVACEDTGRSHCYNAQKGIWQKSYKYNYNFTHICGKFKVCL